MITECSIVTPVQKKWFAAVTHRRVSTDCLKDTLDKRNTTKEGLKVLFESDSFTQSTQYFIQFGCSFHQKHFSTVHQMRTTCSFQWPPPQILQREKYSYGPNTNTAFRATEHKISHHCFSHCCFGISQWWAWRDIKQNKKHCCWWNLTSDYQTVKLWTLTF